MLVLTRKQEEKILIEGNIEIQVLRVKGNTVKIGVKAPGNVTIMRGELMPFGIAGSETECRVELADHCPGLVTKAG